MRHHWGDAWFEANGNDLYSAISFIMKTWKRYGRIGSRGKEKWGNFQDYPTFWDGGIHELIYPGYVYIQRPFIYFKLDRYIIKPFTKYTGLHRLGLWYQFQVYNYVIQRACKKYPNLVDELVSDLDCYELVKPGIFGNVCGMTIHSKHWKTYV
jgi:hypothetical protein